MRYPNDWQIKNCLLLTGGIAAIQLLIAFLALTGLNIPLLQQLNGFLFLTFVPGTLILRILRVHNINKIEAIIYSSGLSLAFVMCCGILINFVLPAINILKPFTAIPINISLIICTGLLMVATIIRDRTYKPVHSDQKVKINISSIMFLVLLLMLTLLGVMVNNTTGNNIIQLICIVLICLIMAFAAFRIFILPPIFPVIIFIISLCLLYQTTLLSHYLVGTDIYVEYQVFQQVSQSGIWNYTIPHPVNSCLSITILGPIYSQMLNIDGIWVFKVIYPFIFSLVPLVLFRIFRIQFGSYRALFATFLFMAVPTFSLEMISLCRQQVAELFFVLFVLLLVERRLNPIPKIIMLTIFIISIAVSHYSLGIISLIYIVALIPLIIVLRSSIFVRAWGWLTRKTGGLPPHYYGKAGGSLPLQIILVPFVFFIIFVLIGYSIMSSGINLELITSLWTKYTNQLGNQITGALFGPMSWSSLSLFRQSDSLIRAAFGMDFMSVSWQGQLFRILQYITQIFIILGCLRLLFRPRGLKIKPEFMALSLISVLLLIACIVITGFADRLNTTRWYHLSLIMLAPMCILGGELVWTASKSLYYRLRHIAAEQIELGDSTPGYIKAFSLAILIPYFLVSAGFIFEITGQTVTDKVDTPYSIALSSYRIDLAGIFNKKDGAAALWLSEQSNPESVAFTDHHAYKILWLYGFPGQTRYLNEVASLTGCYLYFTDWNISRGELTYAVGAGLRRTVNIEQDSQLKGYIENGNVIYVNNGAKVLLAR